MTANDRTLLIIYPWGIDSVIDKNIGAGMRVGLLAEFLREHGFMVTVASVGRSEREIELDGINYREFRYPSNLFLLVLYASMILFSSLLKWQGLQAWLYYCYYQLDRRFVRLMKGEVAKAGTILLEYPFWSGLIEERKERTILTDHDIIAKSWTTCGNSWLNFLLFKTLLARELKAMEAVSRTVFVAESDRDFFVNQGLKRERAAVITNPIILPPNIHGDTFSPQPLSSFGGTEFHTGALFVGSGWYPNREAAQTIAALIAPACPEVTFFIAGDCARWVKNAPPNVRLLGVLSSEDLSNLYRLITFALIPVTWGTGSSLKAVEAMAYGKVIVSTPVGVRGLTFEHGVHGIISPDISEFSALINGLTADPDHRHRLESNALDLAKQYCYRTIYMRYLELIDALPNNS